EGSTEYYIKDAGRQMRLLAESVEARCRQLIGQDATFPEDGYRGAYIDDLAKGFLAARQAAGQEPLSAGLTESCGAWAYARMLEDIKADLDRLGLRFDPWVPERALFG